MADRGVRLVDLAYKGGVGKCGEGYAGRGGGIVRGGSISGRIGGRGCCEEQGEGCCRRLLAEETDFNIRRAGVADTILNRRKYLGLSSETTSISPDVHFATESVLGVH